MQNKLKPHESVDLHRDISAKSEYNDYLQRRESTSGMFFHNCILNKTEDENEKWFTSKEASNFLRITPNALRILVHRAKIRAYKLGNKLRFKKSDLLLILQPKED